MSAPSTGFRGGVAILDPGQSAILQALDEVIVGWAGQRGAAEIIPPPLYTVADLEKFEVYDNFPHLALVAGGLRTDSAPSPENGEFAAGQTLPATLGLPTATCFGAYLYLEGEVLPDNTLLTLSNRSFRNEEYFDGLRRLLCFHMREIVAVGDYEHTQTHLTHFTDTIQGFASRLGLELSTEVASDPFFAPEGSRALLQRLSAVKNEFQVDGLAISSVNTHRNYFGERCGIRLAATGESAFTSCVAFGLERWVSVLLDRFSGDSHAAADAVRKAAALP